MRLDYIGKFKPHYIDLMTEMRALYVDRDKMLEHMLQDPNMNPEAARTLALARTKNEEGCMYAIKTLCLLGEEDA